MRHILVVDDEVDLALLIQGFFELNGYRVSVAHDGVAALEADGRDPVDGVITDLTMPRMNGRELVTRLRERHPDLPAIIISGYAGDQAPGDPHTAVFGKPVSLALLVQRLGEMMAGTQARPAR